MTKLYRLLLIIMMLVPFTGTQSAWAQWVPDGVGICTATDNQYNSQLVSDGAGGAIITWEDYRSGNYGSGPAIYVQRVDVRGNALWTANGVTICTVGRLPQLVADGTGGAIIAWQNLGMGSYRNINAQRVDANGNALWATNGVPICTASMMSQPPRLVSDGTGGAIFTWFDERGGGEHIYAQRVDANGNALWATNGVPICAATGDQYAPQLVSAGVGGAIITWYDYRSGSNSVIYAQRVDAGGNPLWATNGVALCPSALDQINPRLVSDEIGGAIIAWQEYHSGNSEVHAQHVDASGLTLWPASGVAICTVAGGWGNPHLASDGAGGAIVTWCDHRSGTNYGVYAQRVDATGNTLWPANGVAICTAGMDQQSPRLVSDGAGGVIITWYDWRSGNMNIYAQRVDAKGNALWATNGVPICTESFNQVYPQLASDEAGGAIVTWEDSRNGGWDIYAQRVVADGRTGSFPEPPHGLAGTPIYYDNSVVALLVTWNRNTESNISHYNIYRDISEDFRPGPTNLLASPIDTFLGDGQWRWMPRLFYKVTAVDSDGNESNPALLRTQDIPGVTGVEGSGAPNVAYLAQNSPNPFNPSTEIRYYLPERCSISLNVYDITGALVTRLTDGYEDRGNHSVSWNGRDRNGRQVSSGVYFYRLKAGKTEISKKMVLAR